MALDDPAHAIAFFQDRRRFGVVLKWRSLLSESVPILLRSSCLAAVASKDIPLLGAALKGAGESPPTILSNLNVAKLGALAPDVLVADIDHLAVDQLEMLRQLRFVLPDCVIVVYTEVATTSWGRACHLAGASGLLSKTSREAHLIAGLQHVIRSGCFTDPQFTRLA